MAILGFYCQAGRDEGTAGLRAAAAPCLGHRAMEKAVRVGRPPGGAVGAGMRRAQRCDPPAQPRRERAPSPEMRHLLRFWRLLANQTKKKMERATNSAGRTEMEGAERGRQRPSGLAVASVSPPPRLRAPHAWDRGSGAKGKAAESARPPRHRRPAAGAK